MYFPIRISTPVRNAYRVLAIAAVVCIAASAWAGETVLYSFPGGANGSYPVGILAMDSSGNLYGTTNEGGLTGNCGGGSCGIVYELSPNGGGGWTQTVLYSFQGNTGAIIDGGNPLSGVILDSAGNLYGTTLEGGDQLTNCFETGCGTVYELVRGSNGTWTEKILYEFTGGNDGADPIGGLTFDSQGNLYGTTSAWGDLAGCGGNGCGAVFKLAPNGTGGWTETTLHTFSHTSADGNTPTSSLAIDGNGNLFGTTSAGGLFPNVCPYGCGTVFNLAPQAGGSFQYKVIYKFGTTTTDGNIPNGGIILGAGDNIFGTTADGGSAGAGNVWQLSHGQRGWTASVLYSFQGGTDGFLLSSTLVFGAHMDLYGTTVDGGNTTLCHGVGCGTIFHLSRSGSTWSKKTLFRFNQADGKGPANSGLIKDSAGNLYGITGDGGSSGYGVVFQFTP